MSVSRPLLGLVAAATTVSLVASPATAARVSDPKPVAQGAGWLSSQLTKNLVHNEQYGFDDLGLSIDVALGLHASGKKATVVQGITKAVARNITSYTSYDDGTYVSVFAGSIAKAATLAQQTGRNPRSFGGQNLIAQLEGRVSTAAPNTGRIQDDYDTSNPDAGDYANVIGQAYAAQALADAKSPQTAPVEAFLLEQQCSDGYFRLSFNADKSAADQTCDGAPKAQRTPDTDATAIAVLALQHVKGAKAKSAVKKAVAWLVDVQGADGSFGGGKSTKDANANSTGLAGWALGETGATGAAARAAVWVRNLQVSAPNPCSNKLAKSTGAIAYDADAYGTAQGFGIKKKDQDQWRRASAQALPALRWAPKASGAFTVSAPRAVQQGKQLRVALTGVAPGQRVCVTEGASSYEFLSGPKATRQVTFAVASNPGVRTFGVWLGGVERDVTVRVTG